MLKLNLNKKKYFFLISFRYIFLNYNYLLFLKCKNFDNNNIIIKECAYLGIGFKKVMGKNLKSLFFNDFFMFLKNNHYLLFFNDYALFSKIVEKLNNFLLFSMSFYGYFLNNNYLKNINNLYCFNNNNYNQYILYIYLFINKYIYKIYLLFNLLLKLFINFNLKLNNINTLH
jgi:hypothetical protein